MDKEKGLLEDWEKWKRAIGTVVNTGEGLGLTDDTINNASYRVGDFLTSFVDPKNKEEALLKELWKEGNEEEQRTLAKLIVRVVDKKN